MEKDKENLLEVEEEFCRSLQVKRGFVGSNVNYVTRDFINFIILYFLSYFLGPFTTYVESLEGRERGKGVGWGQ